MRTIAVGMMLILLGAFIGLMLAVVAIVGIALAGGLS